VERGRTQTADVDAGLFDHAARGRARFAEQRDQQVFGRSASPAHARANRVGFAEQFANGVREIVGHAAAEAQDFFESEFTFAEKLGGWSRARGDRGEQVGTREAIFLPSRQVLGELA
jgi:hypothetical protein